MANRSPPIAQIQSDDNVLNRFQQNVILGVEQVQQQLLNTPSGGIFITTKLTSGTNNIKHNLGKVPTGFIITDIDAAATIYRISFSNALVVLNASAPATTTIFLF